MHFPRWTVILGSSPWQDHRKPLRILRPDRLPGVILVSTEHFGTISWQMWTAIVAGVIGSSGLTTLKNRHKRRALVFIIGSIGIVVAGLGLGILLGLPLTLSLD